MTTGGVDALFLDTNVLVYATAPTSPLHTVAASRIAAEQAGAVNSGSVGKYYANTYPRLAGLSRSRRRFPPPNSSRKLWLSRGNSSSPRTTPG